MTFPPPFKDQSKEKENLSYFESFPSQQTYDCFR